MPIYEYQCKACGHELEVIQKISEEPLRFCPECGKEELSKLVSAAGFRLKGGGWYETDFKGSKDKKKNLAGDGQSEKKSESKSESKPATASEGSKSASAD
jgi:putative FmdB family regulatory protein